MLLLLLRHSDLLFSPETEKLSIEEVSLVFDYGTEEGRKRAAAAFEARMSADAVLVTGPDKTSVSSEHVEEVK